MRDGQHAGVKTAFLVLDWPLKGGRMLVAVTLYTTCMNLLALTCPVYMFMLYDRVLPAHDAGKLLALTFAMLLLYALSARLDLARQRAFSRFASVVDRRLAAAAARRMPIIPLRDLDQIRSFLVGQAPPALCDLPWLPVYLTVLFLLHPLFGVLAFAAGVSIGGCLLAAERSSQRMAQLAATIAQRRWRLAVHLSREGGSASAGVPRRAWRALHTQLRDAQDAAVRPMMMSNATLRALRPALQTGTLGLGGYLAMTGACSPAAILIASILMPRVLGPLETAITHWRALKAAYASAVKVHGLAAGPPVRVQRPSPDAHEPAIILHRRGGPAQRGHYIDTAAMEAAGRSAAE